MTEGSSATAHNETKIFPSPELLVAVVFIYDNYASDQHYQISVSIIRNYFGIILEVIGQDRGSFGNNQQQQPIFFCYLNATSYLCSSMTIKLHIKTLKPMCLSSKTPL